MAYSPLAEFGVNLCRDGAAAIYTCGPHTGHMMRPIAFCDKPETAAFLAARATNAGQLLEALERCEAMVSTDAGPPDWDWVRSVIAHAKESEA